MLAATLIVKDEAATLPDCLASLHGIVDEIVVYDTGSTDDTVTIARTAGARVIQGYWDNDFARARNAALDLTRADWILVIDADERLTGDTTALRAYLQGDPAALPGAPALAEVDVVRLRVVNISPQGLPQHSLESIRIARRAKARWHGRIHELLQIGGQAPGAGAGFALPEQTLHLRHHGYADPELHADKAARNLELARAQVDSLARDGHPQGDTARRAVLDLGRAELAAGHRQQAVDAFETVRAMAPAGPYRAQATVLLAQTLLDAGGMDRVVLYLTDELRSDGLTHGGLIDWLRAQALAALGRRGEALELLRGVRDLVEPNGNRPGLERVHLVRTLLAAQEGLVEEAALTLLDTLTRYGPHGQSDFLLSLWQGRETELADRLERSDGPFRHAVLAELGWAGQTAGVGS